MRPRRNTLQLVASWLLLGLLPTSTAPGQGDLPSGEEIARRINSRNDGRAVSETLVMELIDRNGKKRIRTARAFRKDFAGERRSVLFYQSPPNLRGTAFLIYDYPKPEREDDQWLYLPALRKVRRVSASNRGDPFMGTDFTYEDIKQGTRVNVEDYSWHTRGEEALEGRRCYIVDAIPVSHKIATELGYSRVCRWVDAATWMSLKGEFWDSRGDPLKTIYANDVRKVDDIWTAHRLEVQNQKTGHRTVFLFSEVDYEADLDDALFTQQALRQSAFQ